MAFEGDPGAGSTGKQRGHHYAVMEGYTQRWRFREDHDKRRLLQTMEGFPIFSGPGFISL